MWLEEDAGARISSVRFAQAMTTGAQAVATACPYCLQMLEDAARGQEAGESIAIKDIAEILAETVPMNAAVQ